MSIATRETTPITPEMMNTLERSADIVGIRLEYVNGMPIWETSPVIRHQKVTDRIRASIRVSSQGESCDCIHYPDIYILFPDGSIKRPDISIFCEEPPQQETMCETIPEAVIEIISKGYEKKDLEVSLPFYLSQGIADVIIFDPATNKTTHHHDGQTDVHDSPVELTLHCGCHATV